MGARRLTIFAKGNADLRDTLHALREDGRLAWNGINEALRARHPGWSARLIHETTTRADALFACPRAVPEGVAAFPLGAYAPATQFDTALFDRAYDAVILSIQPDVMTRLARHRGDGHLLYPHEAERWDAADRQRLARDYAPVPLLAPEAATAALEGVIARLKGDPAVLVFGMSAALPGERVRSYRGLPETLSERIRRFNLALIDLSRRTGAGVIDVDAIFAREGAARLMHDALHLTEAGARLLAGEVVRALEEAGRLPEASPCA